MLGQRLLYVILSLSLLTISCKGSNNSSSDNKKKMEEPRYPISQPLPEMPHDRDQLMTTVAIDFSDAKRSTLKFSRKFCLKVIHGKYIPSVLCHDFDPNENYEAYRYDVVLSQHMQALKKSIASIPTIRIHILKMVTRTAAQMVFPTSFSTITE